ncbi:MAG TPA: glycosyltransferase family 4 protein [Verrucomicrobia bacterium]|nr:glycosyltransferase family 4 protein [Verrucomicrobiota bacterium]
MSLRIAILTVDDRQTYKDYSSPVPLYEKAQQALLEGFARLPEVEVHVISCVQRPVPTPTRFADNITSHCLHVPKIGWLRTLYQGCIRATRRQLRALKPDIVHAQGTERDCGLDAVFSGFPNVVTIHGNMKAIAAVQKARIGGYYWLAAKLETPTLRRTLGVFCNSAYTEGLVAPRARRTWRVPNAIRSAFFEKPPTAQPASVPVLLNVGVVDVRKRQLEILAVARRLWHRGLRFELQFAGVIPENDYAREFRRQLAEAETAGFARHIGVLGLDELIQRLDASAAMRRLIMETLRNLRSQWRAERRFWLGAALNSPVHHAMICIKYWQLKRKRNREPVVS